ncbi:MAG: hypothetical protein FLDDKLPJ_00166 [Phycisphaerae bacterium]|nr:hypothetical protein [Phycisphaerae bacterium]
MTVTGQTRGGEAVSTWYGDDGYGEADYAAQADLSFVAGNRVALLVRYIDADNFMGVELRDNGTVNLIKMLDGRQTTVASGSYSGSAPYTTYVRCSGTSYVVRVEGSQVFSTTDSAVGHGTVALWAERSGKFEGVKAGDDSGADGGLDDGALGNASSMTARACDPLLTAGPRLFIPCLIPGPGHAGLAFLPRHGCGPQVMLASTPHSTRSTKCRPFGMRKNFTFARPLSFTTRGKSVIGLSSRRNVTVVPGRPLNSFDTTVMELSRCSLQPIWRNSRPVQSPPLSQASPTPFSSESS